VWFLPAFLVAVFATTAGDRQRDQQVDAAFVDSTA
jgi:hypothetical protein